MQQEVDTDAVFHLVFLQAGVELRPTHPKHYTYLQLPLYDMPEQDIVAAFPAAFRFIESAMEGGRRSAQAGHIPHVPMMPQGQCWMFLQ